MEVIMRGVRGGIANPSPDTAFFGGNTACIELRGDDFHSRKPRAIGGGDGGAISKP
ncbi:MAG: hypothetical protein LBE89_06275 [Helicobacteraceae bacterium]|jgi:hypothetical protein|nr:hypothetical protein [Helicobacteraceae bacterium]